VLTKAAWVSSEGSLGRENVLKGVPGFVVGGDGGARGRERTQSTVIAKVGVSGSKATRFPPKIEELSESFARQLKEMLHRRGDTLLHLIDHTANLHGRADSAAASLQEAISVFPVVKDALRYTIQLQTKDRPGSPGNLYLSLRCKGKGVDTMASLSSLDDKGVMKMLAGLVAPEQAEKVVAGIRNVQAISEEMRRLTVLTIELPASVLQTDDSLLVLWVDLAGRYGLACAASLAKVISRFEAVDSALNDHVFEFNAKRQPVRYRSIICRADLNLTDPLGPDEPRFRVISYISKRTGKRNSIPVQQYKPKMAASRMRAVLAKQMGVEPSAAELKTALAARRKRDCSPWITKELISHCYLGKHSALILNQQKQIAGAMEEWRSLRQLFQHLLQK
jgi:hypothetical protein